MTPQDAPHNTGPRSYYIGAIALILVGLVIGLGLSAGLELKRSPTGESAALAATTAPESDSPFVGVVERTLPAVVFVDVKKKVGGPDDADDPQEELFRRFFGQEMRHPRTMPSSGSGFIIDREGHILTNNHVVQNASDITVTLNDKRSFKAKVIGTDPETDVAVIKINGDDLPVLQLGDSDRLRVGDWAIAIGNPLGQLRGSVTVGIVSATGRSDLNIFGGTPAFQDFIQTDASINFGNSGGPLCNIRGEAIGINTAINTSGQGIGFAIPINLAKHVAQQLMASGQVKRAMLGVYLAELTPEIAEGFGINGTQGVLIQNVVEDSPASRAGLRRNDVVVEYNGDPVTDMAKFRLKVADTPVGKRVPIVVLRDGKRVTLNVTLESRDEQKLASATPGNGSQPEASESLAGLKVRELTADEKINAKAKSGVMVTDVEDDSNASEEGIQPGDIVEEVSGKPIATAAGFTKALRDAKMAHKPAVLLVNSNGRSRFVALRID